MKIVRDRGSSSQKGLIIGPGQEVYYGHLFDLLQNKNNVVCTFHWSPHGSLVSIGQHFVATKVVHLPKRTETR